MGGGRGAARGVALERCANALRRRPETARRRAPPSRRVRGSDYGCTMPVGVVLADDNLIIREGIAQLLAHSGDDIELLAQCEDLDSLLEAVEAVRPEVVLTDIRMPPTSTDEGIRVAALLRESHPETGVVILSSYSDPAYALALLESGLKRRAYVLKERVHERAQLVSAIHVVAAGGSMMDPHVVEPLVLAKAR